MSYYPDLTPYEYLHTRPDNNVLNIGWLDANYPYQKGSVSDEILRAILKLCEHPTRQTRGFHVCQFCQHPGLGVIIETSDKQITLGTAEIRVVGENDRVYAAPDPNDRIYDNDPQREMVGDIPFMVAGGVALNKVGGLVGRGCSRLFSRSVPEPALGPGAAPESELPDVPRTAPKVSLKFRPPTNPPQMPPNEIPEGWRVREMPPTQQYPNGYWRLEKPMPQGGWQGINPSTMKPGPQWDTHVPFPPRK